MLTMTYEYKLQPTTEQIATIEQTLDVCRSIWNFALRQGKDWCNSRKSPINACSINSEYIICASQPFPSYHNQAKQLTSAKNQYPQLKAVHSQVLQQVLRTLDKAWDDMKARGFGFPRFKNKYRMRSFFFPQLGKEPIKKECGYRTTRDVASSQKVRNPGINALGHSVFENVCGLEATGSISHNTLVGTGQSRKPSSQGVGIPHFKDIERSEVA